MKPISVEAATHTARKKARDIRMVGEMPGYDMVVAHNKKDIAFEMVPPSEGSTTEDEE